jgi:hypothetical protein
MVNRARIGKRKVGLTDVKLTDAALLCFGNVTYKLSCFQCLLLPPMKTVPRDNGGVCGIGDAN